MPQRDHYEVLGVPRHATPEEIKGAFKKLAAQYHPDRNQDDPGAHDRFKEINLAYQVLSDDGRRSMYDRFGHKAEEPGSPFGTNGPFAGGYVDISEIAIDGLLGDLLGVFGVGRGDKGDLKREIEISFEEAAFGCDKAMRYDRVGGCADCRGTGAAAGTEPDVCATCRGRGRIRSQQGLFPIGVERTCVKCRGAGRTARHACARCRGSGLTSVKETVTLSLPPGVEHGATRLVPGGGNRPRADRAPGDLEVVVHVRPHPYFRREGDDVICTLPVSYAHAALGHDVDVVTLDGRGRLRIPPGTQPGTVLRIKGKGVPRKGGLGRGDQRVEIAVAVPTELSARQRALLEQLADVVEAPANGNGEGAPEAPKTFIDRLRDLFG